MNRLYYEKLVTAGHKAPSADNSQPWHFLWDGAELLIGYARERVQGLTFPPWGPATLLSIGAVIENISQAAAALGAPLEIELLPETRPLSDCYASIRMGDAYGQSEHLGEHPLFQRHTNRFAYRKDPIAPEILSQLETSTEGLARISTFTGKPKVRAWAEQVRIASEVRFQTREIHEWLGASLRFSEADVKKADGLDARTLDLPPGGRQFLRFISDWKRIRVLNKIGIYRLLAGIDAAPLKKAPCIVAVTGREGTQGALDAGRLLARIWIHLNSLGIAVHPYFVVADQFFRLKEGAIPGKLAGRIREVMPNTRKLTGLAEGEALYMLLRVGYPTREAPRSLRLPIERVFTDLTSS